MFSFTFKEYKKTYNSRLSAYLDDFEDNTPDLFLENELIFYTSFHNQLKFIVDDFDKSFEEKINKEQNKSLYLSLINSLIESQYKMKPVPKPSIPPSIVNFALQSLINTSTESKTISNDKNIPIPQYTVEELNKKLKETWDSECTEEYIKSNIKKIFNQIITSTKRIIDFIIVEKSNLENSKFPVSNENFGKEAPNKQPATKENLHPQVFSCPKGYELFEKLHETNKGRSTPLADYSFTYRMMYKDGYILDHFKPSMYRNWLSKHYEIELDKLKTIHDCTTDSRIQNYNTLKELLQIK